MVFFAAATGFGRRNGSRLNSAISIARRVVYVRRAFTKGRLKCTKTEASQRAVPLQAIALDAIERQPPSRHNPLLFPGERGGYLDLHNFRDHHWKPAQHAAGIEPVRRIYDLRHTFATFALRAGISTFDLSRYMGASLTMIDRHYGHLARDGREHAIRLLDELSAGQRPRWTLVDAAWTSKPVPAAGKRQRNYRLSRQVMIATPGVDPATTAGRQRVPIDADAASASESLGQVLWAFGFAGLGVLRRSTSSLSGNFSGNRWQPVATDLACFRGFEGQAICRWLPPIATTGLH
jgi:Phage integrase family